ncbi:hypothetical protein HDU98_000969, partial [Podochytrium sp. JEL0797]
MQRGLLGSSLFPSFAPNDRNSDEDDDATANPADVFARLADQKPLLPTTTSSNPAPTASSFPAFSSFSFNPASMAPSESQHRSTRSIEPRREKRRTYSDDSDSIDMDNNYASSRKSKKESTTKKDKKKKKKRDTKDALPALTTSTASGHVKSDRVYRMDVERSEGSEIVMPLFGKRGVRREEGEVDVVMVVDRKGDSQNARYGSAGGKNVPRYYSIGNKILGAASTRNYRISRTARVAHSVVIYETNLPKGRISDHEYRMALRGKPVHFRTIMDQNAKQIAVDSTSTHSFTTDSTSDSLLTDFIPFPKRTQFTLQPRTDPTTTQQEDTSFPTTATHLPQAQESPAFRESTRKLNLRLQNNPKNLATWIELIALQESLVSADSGLTAAKLGRLRKLVDDKKMAIYEKALVHFPQSIELLVPYLELCGDVWGGLEPVRVLRMWDKVLKGVAASEELWDRYLTVRLTMWQGFGVGGWVEEVERCFGVFQRMEDSESTQSILLHFFTRLCNVLYESGYTERAVALYQGMIEFSCFTPPAFEGVPWVQRVHLFEEFWESECLRVGEKGARGWREDVVGGEGIPGYWVEELGAGEEEEGEDEYRAWFRRESESAFSNWLPQRSTPAVNPHKRDSDQDDEDEQEHDMDPFATIVFDDIKPFLFHLTSPTLKAQLISNFMNLLSCQFNPTVTSTRPARWSGSEGVMHVELMANAIVSEFFPKPKPDAPPSGVVTMGEEEDTESARFPIKSFPVTLSTLFSPTSPTHSASSSPSVFDTTSVTAIQEAGHARLEFVQTLIQQTCRGGVVSELEGLGIPALLSLEVCVERGEGGGVKAALKKGKTFLKEERMNLGVWCWYAGVEGWRGKVDEARRIFQTTILSYRTFPPQHQHDAVLVHLAYAHLELTHNNHPRAFHILVSFADAAMDIQDTDAPPPATRVLKARKWFHERTDAAVRDCIEACLEGNGAAASFQGVRTTAALVCCCVLFEYLHASNLTRGMEESVKTMDEFISRMTLLPALKELVVAFHLDLYVLHSKTEGVFVRPGDLRDAMEKGVSMFPCNSGFWMRFVGQEARTRIENRVRRVLEQELKKNPSPTLWTIAIYSELHHHTGQTYNPHAVRSLLSRALECRVSKHSPSLWYLSILFEILTGNAGKAKQVLFRAIRECPWSKKLYMLAMGELRGVFGEEEVAELVGVMEEKEIR